MRMSPARPSGRSPNSFIQSVMARSLSCCSRSQARCFLAWRPTAEREQSPPSPLMRAVISSMVAPSATAALTASRTSAGSLSTEERPRGRVGRGGGGFWSFRRAWRGDSRGRFPGSSRDPAPPGPRSCTAPWCVARARKGRGRDMKSHPRPSRASLKGLARGNKEPHARKVPRATQRVARARRVSAAPAHQVVMPGTSRHPPHPSWPHMLRPSTSFSCSRTKNVDARIPGTSPGKSRHDE